ncbi:MAG: hypothetical protein OEW12_00755 [Deltaproteobacteria bacterium]|nr:hypothetical protein [Deltaproteobacteria bacterium]
MLVKIIAMGLSHERWKKLFGQLRAEAPGQPFSAGIFSTPEEITFLQGEVFRNDWRKDPPDLLLAGCESHGDLTGFLDFLGQAVQGDVAGRIAFCLVLPNLADGLKGLISGVPPAELVVDGRSRFSLKDPGLLISHFPKNYPRIRLNGHLTALRLARSGGVGPGENPYAEVAIEELKLGHLLNLEEVAAVVDRDRVLRPSEWLKEVVKANRLKLPPGVPVGLYREAKGLFFFPGVPVDQVTGAVAGGVEFTRLFGLDGFEAGGAYRKPLLDGLEKAAHHHRQVWQTTMERVREAENKTDLPVLSSGGIATFSRVMTLLLQEWGFQRCAVIPPGEHPVLEEPALVLELSPAPPAPSGRRPQLEQPLVLPLQHELMPALRVLGEETLWGDLPWEWVAQAPQDDTLTPKKVGVIRKKVQEAVARSRRGVEEQKKKLVLLDQEEKTFSRARENLGELLLRGGRVRVWDGRPPAGLSQALVLSYDQEEASLVLAALAGVAKKRWYDLSPYTAAEPLQNLKREPLTHYREGGGVVFVTPAAHQRLTDLYDSISSGLAHTRQEMDGCRETTRAHLQGRDQSETLLRRVAVQWMRKVLAEWVEQNMERLAEALELLRQRHEKQWFNRTALSRVVIVGSTEENRNSLLAACRELLPGFRPEKSLVVPYDFEGREGYSPAEPDDDAGRRQRQVMLDDYLRVVVTEVGMMEGVDLILVEQSPEVAGLLMERLRGELPSLNEVPAIVVLPHTWAPKEDEGLPWPRTRVVPIRRMGRLTASECTQVLGGLWGLGEPNRES